MRSKRYILNLLRYKMRVGILGRCQFSMFSGSQANATLAVAELMRLQGHETQIITANNDQIWWDDVKELEAGWKGQVIPLKSVTEPYDLVIEVGYFFESAEERARVAKRSVTLLRKHAVLDEIEHSLFPTSQTKRCWEGVSEIWVFDALCNSDDIQLLETLSRLPVYKVPYIWTPSVIEKHRAELKSPLWIQMTSQWLTQVEKKESPWTIHIAETNTSSSSSCTIPMLITRELALEKKVSIGSLKIHNSDHIYKSQFFKDNVWKHARVEDISGQFIGRQRVPDWVYEPMSVCIAHCRFIPFRPMYVDMAWIGIPFIHNSPFISDLGLQRYYYADSCITEGMAAFRTLDEDFRNRSGVFSVDFLNATRKMILDAITPYSPKIQKGWQEAVSRVMSSAVATSVALPTPLALPTSVALPTPIIKQEPTRTADTARKLRIGFSDMWDSFISSYNFFTLMLNEAGRQCTPPIEVEGFALAPGDPAPDLLIFGPFGSTWAQFPSVPKVHFTGENTQPVTGENVVLNLGFLHKDLIEETYLRFPLWILEIDWFGADPQRIVNPKPIPIDRCTKVFPEEIAAKKKFCAFVVSNPKNPLRNAAYQWLSTYKPIDSAGALFNNMGDVLAAGPGGGGGELKKHEFLKNYRFALTYENANAPGYVTEKILHAKASGCVPIYWGDPKINRDFNTKGFIDAQNIRTPAELIEAVRAIDENEDLWREKFMVPAIDEYKLEWTRRTMAECARRILKAATGKEVVGCPRFIGGRGTVEAKAMQKIPRNTKIVEPPLLCTFVTRRFLPSLQLWLNACSAQRKAVPVTARIYYGSDVPVESIQAITQAFDFATILPVPQTTPADFPDFWEPQHFAWKIWIYQTLASDPSLAGRMCLYMDAGCFLSRWPTQWLLKAQDNDICFLEDPRHKNEQFCPDSFCQRLGVTSDEKMSQQIVAGILAFRAGSTKACTLMEEAYRLAQIRDVIVGNKFTGMMPDGRPCGHRHDQSILSVLRIRHGCATFPLDDVYCDTSLRKTYQSGRAIYCHRGNFRLSTPFSQGIDDCYIINLDRRKDRMDRLYATTPDLQTRATRISAVEGRKLQLTPGLANLFRPHDFLWKKAIMGCALSHLSLWYKLVTEHPDIQNFLILEDDVKLSPQWEPRWVEAQPHLPADWDIIYLGGILPPNKEGFNRCKEKVNPYFSRVGPNSFFGQNPPNRYFHWCAYAYVLSRRGAEKVMQLMQAHGGYWTSADHMLCNRVDVLNMYFLDPLVAGCYQDEDPTYQASAFNDFNRVDKFDSDLWNNDERFSKESIEENLKVQTGVDLGAILKEVEGQMNQEQINQEEISEKPAPAPAPASEPVSVIPPALVSGPPRNFKHSFVCITEHNLDFHTLYERDWLYELLGMPEILPIVKINLDYLPPPQETPIVILQRPFIAKYTELLKRWSAAGRKFYILHLSDEYTQDDISSYSFEGCLHVIRNYSRPDMDLGRCTVIPLGYHWAVRPGGCRSPLDLTPRIPFRTTIWSFFGTSWKGRGDKLKSLQEMQVRSRCKFFDAWASPDQIQQNEYIATKLDTLFVPCPSGNNPETFRFYEALECGCLPILVREPDNEAYIEYITNRLQLIVLSSWDEAPGLIAQLWNDKPTMEAYRNHVLTKWKQCKESLKAELTSVLGL